MYQTTSDTYNMRSHRNDDYRLPEGVRPITHRLRDVGYFTANIGYHHVHHLNPHIPSGRLPAAMAAMLTGT